MTDLEYVELAALRARDRVQHDDWPVRRVLRILADELAQAIKERASFDKGSGLAKNGLSP